MLQPIFATVKVILIIYVVCALFLYLAQDKMLFFPQPLPGSPGKLLQDREISFTHKGVTLKGWFIKNEINHEKPLIIYYGGNAQELSSLAAASGQYKAAGAALFINYRGYGASQGRPSQKALFDDALFILDSIVQKEKIPLQDIILVGRSLGSGIAAYVAEKRAVRAVILVTAFDSIINVAKKQYPIFPVRLLLKHPFDSESIAPAIHQPLLNIMAEHDRIIPNQHAKNLSSRWQGPVTNITIPGAGHNDIDSFPGYWEAINSFITQTGK